jgi:hypothetical protein
MCHHGLHGHDGVTRLIPLSANVPYFTLFTIRQLYSSRGSAATQYVIIEYSFFIMRSNTENVMLDEI